MKLLPIGLILLMALGIAACGCHDDDGDHAATFSVIYDGPATSVEVEQTIGASRTGTRLQSVVRIELHGHFTRFVQKDGRVHLWGNVSQLNVRPPQLGAAPTPK